MREITMRSLLLVCSIMLAFFVGGMSVQAAEAPPSDGKTLLAQYTKIEPKMSASQFGIPINLVSSEEGNTSKAEIYSVLDYPFENVRNAIMLPSSWCDISVLHINVKACTFKREKNSWLLTMYTGRKYYQEPEDTHELAYIFKTVAAKPDYLSLLLTAEDGPLSTKDYRIVLQAVPLGADKTLLHLSYRFSYGFFGRVAMKTYFGTIGSGKIGFSVVGTDDAGKPEYVGGTKGAIERNVVRYFYAIQTHVEMAKYPADQRFEKSIERWYELTDRHKKQLFELKKEEYVSNKRKEYQNQLMLQKKLDG